MNVEPKKRFVGQVGAGTRSPADQWSDLVEGELFKQAAEAAWGEFCMNLQAGATVEAAQAYFKLEGAREFLRTLMEVGDLKAPGRKKFEDWNLNQT